jgi:hypothetical protein
VSGLVVIGSSRELLKKSISGAGESGVDVVFNGDAMRASTHGDDPRNDESTHAPQVRYIVHVNVARADVIVTNAGVLAC